MAQRPARRFEAKRETILADLRSTLRKIEVTGLRVQEDIISGSAEIVFDRAGRRYTFACDRYRHRDDNLRAAQLTIEYLRRAMEEYGVVQTAEQLDQQFRRFFLPFEALPDDSALLLGDGTRPWWEVLGVAQNTDKATIVNAYRALAKVHHPDAGGTVEDFKRLRAAYEAGMRAIGEG